MFDFDTIGDIVEKVRGFVVQLGWKKELDMLIQESENQYKVRKANSSLKGSIPFQPSNIVI